MVKKPEKLYIPVPLAFLFGIWCVKMVWLLSRIFFSTLYASLIIELFNTIVLNMILDKMLQKLSRGLILFLDYWINFLRLDHV